MDISTISNASAKGTEGQQPARWRGPTNRTIRLGNIAGKHHAKERLTKDHKSRLWSV